MNILVTGITGYVGSRLAPRLAAEGHAVRGFSRRGQTASSWPIVQGDAVSGAGLAEALEDVQVAYYLMHSLEPSPDGEFGAREMQAAHNFVRAARAAGTERVVYLGGLMPAGGQISRHLTSRLAVERTLLESVDGAVALRASIVIGAGSRSFRLLVRLVERMPVLPLPGWHQRRTSPVDERDVIEILARMATAEGVSGRPLDVAGPEQVTYGELVARIRDLLLLDRPTVSFNRLNVTPIVSRMAALIGQEEYELVGPLMESLQLDLLPGADRAAELVGVRVHSLDGAIEHALAEWEAVEPLTAR
jgi:uncharacterized protein YbjT (DUF2867 family)